MRRRLRWPFCGCIFALLTTTGVHADQATWEKYMAQVRILRQQGAYAEAEKAALAAVAEAEKSGDEDGNLANSWNNLATAYYDTGQYLEAEKFFQRTIHLWEQLFAPDSVEAAKGLNNLAVLYVKMSRFKEAESLLLRALRPLAASTLSGANSCSQRWI